MQANISAEIDKAAKCVTALDAATCEIGNLSCPIGHLGIQGPVGNSTEPWNEQLAKLEMIQAVAINVQKKVTWLQAQLAFHQPSTVPCCACGGEVVEFTVPNDIWNLVMRPDGKETDKEYLCLDCWYKALRSKLDELLCRERAAVENYNVLVGLIAERLSAGSFEKLCELADELEVIVTDWRGLQEGGQDE